jgi:hypothetical protein
MATHQVARATGVAGRRIKRTTNPTAQGAALTLGRGQYLVSGS